MINWFDMPAEGLSNGGLFEVKELEVTENGTYETKGEMYNKVTVNVEGGGSGDFTTAKVTFIADEADTVGDWDGPFIINEPNIGECVSYGTGTIDTPNIELTIVLYKGVASTSIGDTINEVVSTSGNIEKIGKTRYKITGDCTIHYIGEGIA